MSAYRYNSLLTSTEETETETVKKKDLDHCCYYGGRRIGTTKAFCFVLVGILLTLPCSFLLGIRREKHFVRLANATLSNYQTSNVCARSSVLQNNSTSESTTKSTRTSTANMTTFTYDDSYSYSLPPATFVTMEKSSYSKKALLTNASSSSSLSIDIAHCGECGKCSTDQDIDLMIKTKDTLTTDATKCALKGLLFGDDKVDECLSAIGFTHGCSSCWKENIKCTISSCKYTCLKYKFLSESNNNDDDGGSLNACLECDEKMCGPQFIKCAGCNRRRLGIVSDIKRDEQEQCDIVTMVEEEDDAEEEDDDN